MPCVSDGAMSHPVFTIVLDTYYRPAMLRQAVEALIRQSYSYLEIILINNGATPETVDYLREVAAQDERVKLIHFAENQYTPDDPLKMLDTCLNAGLKAATGDYIWYQSDDDWIADDYAEKMVRLFQGNAECITAAGLPVAVNAEGKVMEAGQRKTNLRPRYMPGHEVALDYLRGGNMFSAPGSIFTIRRDVLVKAGGFHRAFEWSQLFGIVPFGVSGFDESAVLYWRRHEGQLNKQLTARGWIGTKEKSSLLKDWEIERRWQVFGSDIAREVVTGLRNQVCKTAARWFAINLVHLRLRTSWRIMKLIWNHLRFWREILASFPPALRNLKGEFLLQLKLSLKRLFDRCPSLATLSPGIARLRERVNR